MSTSANTFTSHYPVTGEVIANYPIADRETVFSAVAAARSASTAWQDLGFKGRRKVLLKWSNLLVSQLDEILSLIHI